MRTCRRCETEKCLGDFRPKRRVCKLCERKYDQDLYWKEPVKRRRNSKAYRDLKRAYIQEKKKDPCSDCGNPYPPAIMQFHHLDPATKKFDLAHAVSRSDEAIDAEIARCVLVCPTCHALRHLANHESPR